MSTYHWFDLSRKICRQYAHFVLATMQMMKCAAHIIGPTMVTLLTDYDGDAKGKLLFIKIYLKKYKNNNNTISGWRNVFILNCVLMLCVGLL